MANGKEIEIKKLKDWRSSKKGPFTSEEAALKLFDDYGLKDFKQAGNIKLVRKWIERANNEHWVEKVNDGMMEAYDKDSTIKVPASKADIKKILIYEVKLGEKDTLYIGEKPIVPIIFVPGIMGTRLRNQNKNEKIWDPDDKGFMIKKYILDNNTSKRKLLGITNNPRSKVIEDNNGSYNKHQLSRGFSNIAAEGVYKEFLTTLDNHRFNVKIDNNLNIETLCPVYVCGFDWRRDMEDTADEYLGETIKKLKDTYENNPNFKGIVIITHSMGGILTRRYLKNPKENAGFVKQWVKGVIHGVQPAAGAVIFYCYFKCGATHFADSNMSTILGKTKDDFEILISDVVGGIELAPTNDYEYPFKVKAKNNWLSWDNDLSKDVGKQSFANDIYKDCYLEKKGLLGFLSYKLSNEILNPLIGYIRQADNFHKKLGLYAHDKTFEISSNNILTATRVTLVKNYITVDNVIDYYRRQQGKDKGGPDFVYNKLTPAQMDLFNTISSDIEKLVSKNKEHDNKEIEKIKKKIKEKFWNFQDERVEVQVHQENEGDGTVPINSQRILSNNKKAKKLGTDKEFNNIIHSNLYNERSSIDSIIKHLEEEILKDIINEKK